MKDKRGYENSFAWIFAIIAGAIIIFLAIYAVTNLIGTFKNVRNSETGLEIGTLLTPFETSIIEGLTNPIKTREETEINNICNDNGDFGTQKISVKVISKIGREGFKGEESSFKNKYLFSEKVIKGKEFYILSKPLDFPFKIGDLIMAWSNNQEYCFVGLRNIYPDIEKDVGGWSSKNVVNVTAIGNCADDSIKVCFNSPERSCDIIVRNNEVEHVNKGEEVYFSALDGNNALLYAAIFSDPEIYDCQIKRLMKRASKLEELYEEKASLPKSLGGCDSMGYLGPYLNAYKNDVNSISRLDLNLYKPKITDAESSARNLDDNNVQNCKLY